MKERFMMKKIFEIPVFKNEEEERQFWEEHDSAEFMNWEKAEEAIFTKLKPSTKTISIRDRKSVV